MIKLFWNTHNQIKPKTITEKGKDSLNYILVLYHQKNSDKADCKGGGSPLT